MGEAADVRSSNHGRPIRGQVRDLARIANDGGLYFESKIGGVEEYSLQDGKVAAHIYLDSETDKKPYLFFAFPAKNAGLGLWMGSELEGTLNELGRRQGVAPETLALNALRERFLVSAPPVQPRDEWERRLLGAAKDCGVSLPDAAVSSEGLYE